MGHETGSSSQGLGPRPEAQPFSWDKLTADQRKVAQDIHEWLSRYLDVSESAAAPHHSPLGWSIDQARNSNVLLIDGGRGSGKTSVLVSLLDLWQRRLESQPGQATPTWEPIEGHLSKLAGRLLPVPVLDLQPLPPSTSLRTWIAGRLLQLAERLAVQSEARRGNPLGAPARWTPGAEAEPAWRSAWRNLLQDAAAGWHPGGGPDRRRLDPESFAVEMEQAEFARLSIVDRWREFVDAVAHEVGGFGLPIKNDARIIIPIDDADMNPTRCVELLDLLRTLWHPKVVFLLTGHSDLFLKTLTLHFLGVFRAQLGGRADSEHEHAVIDQRDPTADDLAIQSYDKVLPPHQRFQLRTLPPDVRLDLLADVLDIKLHRQGAEIPPATVRDYLKLNAYTRPALPDRLRKIQNLRQLCDRPDVHERGAAMVVHALWLDALTDERHSLSTEDVRNIEPMVAKEAGRIRIQGMGWRFHRIAGATRQFYVQNGSSLIRLAEAAGLAFPVREGERTIYLPRRLNAAFLLAVDLFLEEHDEHINPLAPMPGGFDNELVKIDLTHRTDRMTGVGELIGKPSPATWPLPDWRTSVDFAIFDTHWNHALARLHGDSQLQLSTMAFAFLSAVLATYKREPALRPMKGEPNWAALALELVDTTVKLFNQSEHTDRESTFLNWLLGRAILLTAPESGMPPDAANRLLSSWLDHLNHRGANVREAAIQATRAEREIQATRLNRTSTGVNEFLVNLDARFPSHSWASRIELQGKGGERSLQDLLRNELSSFSVNQRNSNLSKPRDLRDYMDELQLQIPVTPRFAAKARSALESLRKSTRDTPQALIWIWKALVDEFSPGDSKLKDRISLTETSDNFDVSLPEYLLRRLQSYEHKQKDLGQEFPIGANDSRLQFYTLDPPGPLTELDQYLILAHDVFSDMKDGEPGWLARPHISADWFAVAPHAGTGIRYGGTYVHLGWPTPRWATFLDWRLEERRLIEMIEPTQVVLQNDTSPKHYRRVLSACLESTIFISMGIGDSRESNASLDYHGQTFDAWRNTGNRLWTYINPRSNDTKPRRDNRSKLVSTWATLGAPLYAAPEMGLPVAFAKGFLAGWLGAPHGTREQDPLKPLDPQKNANAYRAIRWQWAARCLQSSGFPNDKREVRRFLQTMDRQNPDHPWHQVFGAEPDTGNDTTQ
jgi:hypothetical protein